MKNVKLVIEYDGTNYSGWQKQINAVAIQNKIEDAIRAITKEEVNTIGASRTDAGVHAKEYVCNFVTNSNIEGYKFKRALNSKLPSDIVILDSCEVSLDFHARYNCKGKRYVYNVLNQKDSCAIGRNYIYVFSKELDLNSMEEACKYFIGTHDFDAFRNKGSFQKTSTRTITELKIKKINNEIKFYISADGFLYNMARIIVGTLLDVGIGKKKPLDIADIIKSKDRTKAGKAVPAKGLCLDKIYY